MALLLVIVGLILWVTVAPTIGIICIVVGLILFFVPGTPYGYSHYRRGP